MRKILALYAITLSSGLPSQVQDPGYNFALSWEPYIQVELQ